MADDDDEQANLSYSAQHINDLLRCPICLDRFRSPKLLPCQHTFCEVPCLQQLVDRFHSIKCPECRTSHRVPYAGVSSFPPNRTLLNFLDVPTQSLPLPQIANQQPASPDNGNAPQADSSANQDPAPQQQQQQAPAQSNGAQRSGCSSCGRQLSLSRCAHCDMVVCDTCKRSHIDQLRLDITRMVSQLRRGVPSFSDAISVIENKSEQLHQRAEAGKAEITETIERYISELRNRQRLLHSEVQMWLLGEIRSLRMCQENVEVELASTASFCDSTDSTLSRANQTIPDEDLVTIKRQCVEHMEIIRAYEDGSGVQVQFEGNRFSQAISNFGDLLIVESENGSSGAQSGPSRSSSSRESSPQVQPIGGRGQPVGRGQSPGGRGQSPGGRGQSPGVQSVGASRGSRGQSPGGRGSSPVFTPRGRGNGEGRGQQDAMDRALAAIGSIPNTSANPRVAPRRGERMAGLMGGGGEATPAPTARRGERMAGLIGGGGEATPAPIARRGERMAGLMGGGGEATPASTSRPAPRERLSALIGGGGADIDSSTSHQQIQQPLPANLSWELPIDFSYPRRSNIRAGNGSHGNITNNRRSLQERRRHNLSDSGLPAAQGGVGGNQRLARTTSLPGDNTRSNGNVNRSSHNSTQNSQQEVVAGTSSEGQDRPPLTRSRTFTREEFQTIREEDSVSRASTADPINRQRESISFNVDLHAMSLPNEGDNGDVPYQIGSVDGGESTRINVATNNYQEKGRAIIRFGARGSDNREFVWPRGLAVSRGEQIHVADSSNHRVQVFDSIGTFLKSFGSYGQAESEFDCLAGIAINSMGDIMITDRYNHRVQVFDTQLNFKIKFGEEGQGDGQMSYPWGITSDSMGFIYVCDKENHRIQVFQSSGVFVRKFGRLGRAPGQFENPHYIAISPDNKVYVTDSSNHRVQVFSIYGDFIFSFGSIGTMQGQMKYPKGIAIDEQGFVVVADSGNNRIQVFRGDGRFYCMFGGYGSDNGQFKGLEGLALLPNGNVVVSDRENHRIQIF